MLEKCNESSKSNGVQRDGKSVRFKFSGCSEIKSDERRQEREKGSRWRGLVV